MDWSLKSYSDLIGRFVDGRLPVADFEREYLAKFKSDPTAWPASVFGPLDTLFGAVDAYCGDAELLGPGDLTEAQLRGEAERILIVLKAASNP